MKLKIRAVDEAGNQYQGEAILQPISGEMAATEVPTASVVLSRVALLPEALDFSLNARTFAKRYGKDMTGPRIFALLVAFSTKGNLQGEISSLDIEKLWNSMTSIFGIAFNAKYPTKAKEYGWVDSRRRGFYSVTASWQEILA